MALSCIHIPRSRYDETTGTIRAPNFAANDGSANGCFDILGKVGFQWKNPDFLLKNPDFLFRNPGFLLKNVDFIAKTGRAGNAADAVLRRTE